MLEEIIKIASISNTRVEGSTLFCPYHLVDLALFQSFIDDDIIENLMTNPAKIGDNIELEFSLLKLQKLGFYNDTKSFIKKYRYEIPSTSIYINELNQYLKDSAFYSNYNSIVNLIIELQNIAKHTYDVAEIKNVIIVREDKSLYMTLQYESDVVTSLDDKTCSQINNFIEVLKDSNFLDKKNIYLNEFIDFCNLTEDENRFLLLLKNFEVYINKSISTYNFYLRNFSYNKLKLEIDSKAIDFNQKLQAVINDSQTKLIAIPTAFVLVLSSIDYEKIDSPKNIVATGGLFIFSTLLQLFVNNQKSAIKFIEENIDHYKSTFKNQARTEVEKAFNNVNSEKNKQFDRLILIEVLLWFIPIFTLCMLLFFMSYELVAIMIMFFYLWFSSNKLLLKC